MKVLALTAGLAVVLASAALADTRVPAENWTAPYSASPASVPACDSASVLSTVQSRFADTRSEYWASNLQIAGFDNVRPVAYRPWGLDFIPRRFCKGVAQFSDGTRRDVVYSIVEDGGIIGMGWGVSWCVVGLDPALAYAPQCKQAGP